MDWKWEFRIYSIDRKQNFKKCFTNIFYMEKLIRFWAANMITLKVLKQNIFQECLEVKEECNEGSSSCGGSKV